MSAGASQMGNDWRNGVDVSLLRRLWSRARQPGLIDPRLAGRILSRVRERETRLELVTRLLRRYTVGAGFNTNLVPIVHATTPPAPTPSPIQTPVLDERLIIKATVMSISEERLSSPRKPEHTGTSSPRVTPSRLTPAPMQPVTPPTAHPRDGDALVSRATPSIAGSGDPAPERPARASSLPSAPVLPSASMNAAPLPQVTPRPGSENPKLGGAGLSLVLPSHAAPDLPREPRPTPSLEHSAPGPRWNAPEGMRSAVTAGEPTPPAASPRLEIDLEALANRVRQRLLRQSSEEKIRRGGLR